MIGEVNRFEEELEKRSHWPLRLFVDAPVCGGDTRAFQMPGTGRDRLESWLGYGVSTGFRQSLLQAHSSHGLPPLLQLPVTDSFVPPLCTSSTLLSRRSSVTDPHWKPSVLLLNLGTHPAPHG